MQEASEASEAGLILGPCAVCLDEEAIPLSNLANAETVHLGPSAACSEEETKPLRSLTNAETISLLHKLSISTNVVELLVREGVDGVYLCCINGIEELLEIGIKTTQAKRLLSRINELKGSNVPVSMLQHAEVPAEVAVVRESITIVADALPSPHAGHEDDIVPSSAFISSERWKQAYNYFYTSSYLQNENSASLLEETAKGCFAAKAYLMILWHRMQISCDHIAAELQQGTLPQWMRSIDETERIHSYFIAGYCCYYGLGCEVDKPQAVSLFQRAANTTAGHADAEYLLACCYYNGHGTAKDHELASSWWLRAASRGHARAQHMIGCCYLNGDGVAKNRTEAVSWWRQAVAQGLSESRGMIAYCDSHHLDVSDSR